MRVYLSIQTCTYVLISTYIYIHIYIDVCICFGRALQGSQSDERLTKACTVKPARLRMYIYTYTYHVKYVIPALDARVRQERRLADFDPDL